MLQLDTFTRCYIRAALWSSTDDDGEPLDRRYSMEDLADETLLEMASDCKRFQLENAEDIASSLERAGCDFWLSRNLHGAGFWDGDWPEEVGDRLTDASHSFGEYDLYAVDDGKLYGVASRPHF